jgi:hypothetical protein
MNTAYPPKDKVHALLLAMSAEIEALREAAQYADLQRMPAELIHRCADLEAETKAAAIAVGCRPGNANRNN